MRTLYLYILILIISISKTFANYNSPGTAVKWNLDDLVANSGGAVTLNAGEYFINDIVLITATDTLYITTNAIVKFAPATYLSISGVLKINPPSGVKFTAQDIAAGFSGMRIDFSNATVLKKLTFEYGNSLRLFDCTITIDSCIFKNCTPLTNFGTSAISLFRANPIITNCQFIDNFRAAIQGGFNINNAPKIINCLFMGNNTLNQNVPQINLGATSTGNDTVKIINNQILAASTNSGGIGFLAGGSVYTIIKGNTIKNNRYGMTFNGGSFINALISYNLVENNNTQGDPNLGGSGIAFVGGSSTSHQNSIVTGNVFKGNLWGITIQNGAKPNLGNLNNSDTSDNGKNQFINNTNASTPNIDLYNNSPDSISAQNNYWGTNDVNIIEARIFHQADLSTLGFVDYANFALPVELEKFTAVTNNRSVSLRWTTRSENNSDHFEIERSIEGQIYSTIGSVAASGNSTSVREYEYSDNDVQSFNKPIFYRLKIVDKDRSSKYSPVVSVRQHNVEIHLLKIYPTIINANQTINIELISSKQQEISICYYDVSGKLLWQKIHSISSGLNRLTAEPTLALPAGLIYLKFSAQGFTQTIPVTKY